jgi:hypothetical protein
MSYPLYGLLRREFQIRFPWGPSLRTFMAATAVAALLFLLREHVNFIVAGGLGSIAWFIAIRIFRILSKDQREILRGVVPPRFQKFFDAVLGT